ncbi:AIR carboxylase [Pseudobythopirellula maris]|uniref:AIR carboxylase n=1 Tax=Pseudobythopirellula maris TaxID=2527991 RepID=A0A5C5ZS04_9BACT|nr:nickel pincer cofactor biosynthesis protein LarB [Pseudobythopirellula maris]TWT89865.1 AIR carboxylase [Pseudobythopirellula maris]
MDRDTLLNLAQSVRDGALAPETLADRLLEASEQTRLLAGGDVSLDTARRDRCGYPEVVYGEGKTPDAIAAIIAAQQERGEPSLVTRIDPAAAADLEVLYPLACHNATARTWRLAAPVGGAACEQEAPQGSVAVVTAGTTDLPVAEEAAETLVWMGVAVTRINDIGVAGPQRLAERLPELRDADVVIVAAGMEGALPSVVGGHVAAPVIAVPTSVGYGASFGGVTALLGMLNSCSSNVAVVNIDAGFKAGYLAGVIASRAAAGRCSSEKGADS